MYTDQIKPDFIVALEAAYLYVY